MSWYAFHVRTGNENKLCRYFDYIFKDFQEIEYKLMIPRRELLEYKAGTKKIVYKMLFSGYILIDTESISKIYNIMKNFWHPEIYALIRTQDYFQKITAEEILPILEIINEDGIIKMSKIHVLKNRITVIDGALLNYTGRINKINPRKGRARISMDFLNCKYDFDIGVKCVEKLSDIDLKKEMVSFETN